MNTKCHHRNHDAIRPPQRRHLPVMTGISWTRARLETGRTLPLGSWSLASLVWPRTWRCGAYQGGPATRGASTRNRLECRTPSRTKHCSGQPPACLSGNAPFVTATRGRALLVAENQATGFRGGAGGRDGLVLPAAGAGGGAALGHRGRRRRPAPQLLSR